MKAVFFNEYGGPEVLEYGDMPDPVLKDDDVLIKVFAASVNPVDWRIRKGERKEMASLSFPYIPGYDVSGEIIEAGKNVKEFKVGELVYARPDWKRNGSYAELIAVKWTEIAHKPKLTHIESAAIPLTGLTAWQGLFDHGKLLAGQTVFINGGSGGVGIMAIQFARWKGARVITSASPANFELLQSLGADQVIDYHQTGFEKDLHDVDLLFDTVGGQAQTSLSQMVVSGGAVVGTRGILDEPALNARQIRGVKFMAQSIPLHLWSIAELVDHDLVKPVISKILPLADAQEAHRLSEAGHTVGKIVLQVI